MQNQPDERTWHESWSAEYDVPTAVGQGHIIKCESPAMRTVCVVPAASGEYGKKQYRGYAKLIRSAPQLRRVLIGCADALKEAGKMFALNNPEAARPNLYELHEQAARELIEETYERNRPD